METIQINTVIEDHYNRPGLFEDITERLKWQGISPESVTRSNIAGVDEFHLRGAEVSKEIAEEAQINGAKVLDIGCGIGGPARMLADEHNCTVTGIDMSSEFIRTAQKLSAMVGLESKTEFVYGDALELPFEGGSFDAVWTQHVQMNIEDKERFYSEAARVMKSGGKLIYHDIFRNGENDAYYPVPWANDAAISFLQTISNKDRILNELGFKKVKTTDQTEKAIQFLNNLFVKISENGLPKLGLNVLIGASTVEKLRNVHKSLIEKKIVLQSGIYQKSN